MNADFGIQSEEARNRVLRRSDWRFLLPNPQPVKGACFSGGLLAQAVESMSAQMVEPDKTRAEECDLIAAADPAPAVLTAAWRALRPGGVFYSEWRSPISYGWPLAGWQSLRKRLEKAGFTEIKSYWPWPAPSRGNPSFWLPLDAPHALDYFLKHRPRPSSALQHVTRPALVTAWHAALHNGLLAPICITAQKPHQAEQYNLSTGMDAVIINRWKEWGFDDPPEHLSRLLLTGGARSTNKVVALIFSGKDKSPLLAVKFPRTPDSIPGLVREKEILQAIHAAGADKKAVIPRVLFFHDRGSTPALGETPITGQPLYTFLQKTSYRALALKVTGWLTSLVWDTRFRPRTTWWDRLVSPVLADFEKSFRPVGECLQKTRAVLESLDSLPEACEQRDCSPWNILITREGELGVLDWESSEQKGLPVLDLIYFLTYMAFFLDGAMESGKYIDSYLRAQNPTTFIGSVQAECQQLYLHHTGLDPAVLHPLRLLTWLVHSRSDYKQISADVAKQPDPGQLQNSLFYQLWLTELRLGVERDSEQAIASR